MGVVIRVEAGFASESSVGNGIGVAVEAGVAAVAEGTLEVREGRVSGTVLAGKSEVVQPAARARLSPIKLVKIILRNLCS